MHTVQQLRLQVQQQQQTMEKMQLTLNGIAATKVNQASPNVAVDAPVDNGPIAIVDETTNPPS